MSGFGKPSEFAAVTSVIEADEIATGTEDCATYTNMANFEQALIVFNIGVGSATGTIVCSVVQATDASGTGAKAITGKTTAAIATAGDQVQHTFDIKAADLDVAGGFDFIGPRMVVATDVFDAGAIVLGFNPYNGPASDNDLSTVTVN